MKKILFATVLFLSIIFQGQAQRFDYEDNSKLFFGLNIGRTWHTSDVENVSKRFPLGVGFIFGGSVNQNYGNLFSYDIRLRYLGGNWIGQDSDTTHAIQQNTAVNAIYDTLGYTVQNFKATQHRLSLELSIHANRLKERSGIDPYIFAGIGFTNTRTKGDLVNNKGGFYPYNQNTTGNIIDKDYNTPLDINDDGDPYKENEFDVKVLPSLGVGIGYYFNSRFSLGIEHKTTFFMDDYFDGTTVNQNGQPSELFGNDLYHYTSIYFKWYLKTNERTYEPQKDTKTPPVAPRPEKPEQESERENQRNDKPIVHFTTPAVSPYHVNAKQFNLIANVLNVKDAKNITFSENGRNSRKFSFNPNTKTFQAQVTLKPGENIFYLEGKNAYGKDFDQTVVIYKEEIYDNTSKQPIVDITDPSRQPHRLNQLTYTVVADIKNVKARNQVVVTFNGQKTTNFSYKSSGNNNFSIPLQLKAGTNTLRIEGRNNFGKDSDETVLIYQREKPSGQPPVVNILTPNMSPYTTAELKQNIVAKTTNIDSKNQIEVRINGVKINNFTYNSNTHRIAFNADLKPSTNTIKISVNNAYGNDFDETQIIYKRKTTTPPIVNFKAPSKTNTVVNKTNYNVIAQTKNIDYKGQLKLYFNGNLIPSRLYTFNNQKQEVNYSSQLTVGKNTFKIIAQNKDGKDEATTNVERIADIKNSGEVEEGNNNVSIKPNVDPCLNPEVQLMVPKSKSTTVKNNTLNLRAVLKNINNIGEIQLTQNGRLLKSFDYHPRTRNLSSVLKLENGKNNFTLTLTNKCGTISEKFNITYNAPPACNVLFITEDFCLNTPSETIEGGDLLQNPGFTYNGPAKSLYFKAIANGKATVNGKDFTLIKGNYYHFMGNITVEVGKNRKGANGQWSLCVGSMLSPLFGKGENRPTSPCATSIKIKPNTKAKPNVRKKPNKRERPSTREKPDKIEQPNRREQPKTKERPNVQEKPNRRSPRGGR